MLHCGITNIINTQAFYVFLLRIVDHEPASFAHAQCRPRRVAANFHNFFAAFRPAVAHRRTTAGRTGPIDNSLVVHPASR
jgi:hypothetical protein